MRKRSLLAAVGAGVTAVRTEFVIGEQEFQGQAAPFVSTINSRSYAVISCAQMEENGSSACNGQCAEVWCDSDKIGGCTLETRQTVRVVDNCTNCGLGDVALSGDVYQQLSVTHARWIPIRWRCVDCGMSSGDSHENEGSEVRRTEELICPGYGSSVDIKVTVGVISVENTTNETRKVVASRGDSSFSDLDLTASTDTDTSGSLDAVIEWPSLDNSSSSDSSIWSDSSPTQIDAKPWNGQGENTASPTPTFPSVPRAISSSASSSLSSPVNSGLSSPAPTALPAIPSNRGSWSDSPPSVSSRGGIAPSASSPPSADPASGDTSYPVGSVAASDDNPRDKADSSTTTSTSHGLSGSSSTTETPDKNRPPASPAQSAGNINKSSSDGNFSATSTVTRSPFFYASLMLGVVGLIGIIVGYRAKRKRNHRNEMRALQVSMRQSTRTPTPTSCLRVASLGLVSIATT